MMERHPHSTFKYRFLWLKQLASDTGLSPAALRVAVFLADNTNKTTGLAFPSQETIATKIGVTTNRAVQKLIALLVERGHMAVTPGRGKGKTSEYRLIFKSEKDDAKGELAGHLSTGGNSESEVEEKANSQFRVSPDAKGELAGPKRRTTSTAKGELGVRPTLTIDPNLTPGAAAARERARGCPLLSRLAKLMGVEISTLQHRKAFQGFADLVAKWQSAGCDPEQHIWPTIEHVVARGLPINSAAYFEAAIFEKRDGFGFAADGKKLDKLGAAIEAMRIKNEENDRNYLWRDRVDDFFLGSHPWDAEWGPTPTEIGCRAPSHILVEALARERERAEQKQPKRAVA